MRNRRHAVPFIGKARGFGLRVGACSFAASVGGRCIGGLLGKGMAFS